MAFILASALSTYLFSQQSSLSKGVNYLSEFIASDYFLDLKKNYSDLDLVDSIYIRALEFYDYDYEEALLALTFATIPFRKVPLVIPFINVRIYYPLISANDSISNLKNQNLPAKLFYDTPDDSGGDKDKLAHFFGNAFIGYAENVLKLADVFGYFVEAFEEDFKAQSEVDFRDVDVNWYGVLFGDMLELNKKILPSQIMTLRSLRYFIITL
ncbi:MAG: hypothetical protein HS131_10525 [Ignavibacteriales bacterium]|jgi:hypothetical protein|nr:hypothetical protein [Ignavibacteriales bacterium]MCC7093171.1 hypothetical protein [Ignavibacteriaceae bacterium]MEB2295933.1 hypothetical protein [Ignavibacteria bacterium]NUM61760.1 hypothetical protein [Ignavibacteriaceae bacterium]